MGIDMLRRGAVAAICVPLLAGCGYGAAPTATPQRSPSATAATDTTVPAKLTKHAKTVKPAKAASSEHARPKASPTQHPRATPHPRVKPSAYPKVHTKAPTKAPAMGAAAALLASLPVKGRAPMTGYDRDEFGAAWLDADRNGCDTRDDILARDLSGLVYEPGTRACVVFSGHLSDPYTRRGVDFIKGDGTLVDIDHVVALGNAWSSGAFGWPIRKRAALANDPLNLLAVDASANRQKGDGDAATWLPANKRFRCAYVARQGTVKDKYRLWVTAPEEAVIARVLAGCPTQAPLKDSGAPVIVPVDVSRPQPAIPAPAPGPVPAPATSGGASVYYENCDAARAAGAAPVHLGDPGYGSHLDRDGDGVGCE